jgi:hypothetical protein
VHRRLIDVEAHQAVFTRVQERLVEAHLLRGKTLAVDATTLEANAAMRSIVRRDTGESIRRWSRRGRFNALLRRHPRRAIHIAIHFSAATLAKTGLLDVD